jgi:hypothetical protein
VRFALFSFDTIPAVKPPLVCDLPLSVAHKRLEKFRQADRSQSSDDGKLTFEAAKV